MSDRCFFSSIFQIALRGPKKKDACPAKPQIWETPQSQPRLPHLRRLTYRNYFIDVEEGEKTQQSPGSLRARSVPTERTRRFSSFSEGAEEELEREKDGFSKRPADGVLDKLGEGLKTPVDSVVVFFFATGDRGVFVQIKP